MLWEPPSCTALSGIIGPGLPPSIFIHIQVYLLMAGSKPNAVSYTRWLDPHSNEQEEHDPRSQGLIILCCDLTESWPGERIPWVLQRKARAWGTIEVGENPDNLFLVPFLASCLSATNIYGENTLGCGDRLLWVSMPYIDNVVLGQFLLWHGAP